MARARKRADEHTHKPDEPDVFDQVIAGQQLAEGTQQAQPTPAQQSHAHGAEQDEQAGQYQPKWVNNFAKWADDQAGVKLREDRRNKLHTIAFRETAPESAVELLLSRGYQEDPEVKDLFAKPINELRRADSHDEAQELARDVANLVRADKGLPQKGYYISRS